jgi:hypothetical protein
LKKSKFERLGKSRESRVLDLSTAARLCIADTKGRGVGNDMVPHVAAREAHQRSLKFSCFTRKRLFQHYLPQADSCTAANWGQIREGEPFAACRSKIGFLAQADRKQDG